MSEKVARQVRKEMNAIRKNIILELLNSPYKYRFMFAMKLLFFKRKKEGK